jgi:hypothetical protein
MSILTCNYCEKEINSDDIILPFSHKNYHKKCLIEHFVYKSKPKLNKELAVKKVELIELEYNSAMNEKLNKMNKRITNSKNILSFKEQKKELFNWIAENYEIFISWQIENKIKSIVDGSLQGLNEAISCEDLLTIFQKKKDYLDKIYVDNKNKGKIFVDKTQRFYYDLKIVISKYDSFKKWKRKNEVNNFNMNEILEKEKEEKKFSVKKCQGTVCDSKIDLTEFLD